MTDAELEKIARSLANELALINNLNIGPRTLDAILAALRKVSAESYQHAEAEAHAHDECRYKLSAAEAQLAEVHNERDEALRDRDLNAEAHVQAVSALIAANAEVDKFWALLQRSKETFDWLYDRHGAQSAKLRSQEIAAMSNPEKQ